MRFLNSDAIPVTVWEIEAHLDGVTDRRVASYLRRDPSAASLAELDPLEEQLSGLLYRSTCPDSFDVLNYQWGMLDREEAVAIAAHLSVCPHCSVEAEELAEPALQFKAEPASNVWSKIHSLAGSVRQLVARLLADHELELAPVRTPSAELVTTQIYRIDQLDWDIILEYQPDERLNVVNLRGQLLADNGFSADKLQISVLNDTAIISTVPLDELGCFDFTVFLEEANILCIHGDDLEICIPYWHSAS